MSRRPDRQELDFTSGIPPYFAFPSPADNSVKPESLSPTGARNKRPAPGPGTATFTMSGLGPGMASSSMASPSMVSPSMASSSAGAGEPSMASAPMEPPPKKSRTNTPWTPAEEQRLKNMRDAGNSWAEIAKTFPSRTEGSVKKHWYKDMHYAEFAEDESQALLNAIKEYETNKWKVIGAKVGKPAKACEQYAKEHFAGRI
ncbi:hypothetical protein M430DRAFT_57587 [Amorphotheca resinae ATCC 22711]|uniref:Myb-like domain-containing protein n=1 Tax=Amorphotheca resinae ATCC 22711 TaxID=857342 RepID=A0A2T3B676_AMORE|nr:hypothetical protein M430DRAFT_57587 [Amorphotheca resinae ATCC 22711]PSS22238.1 hypothetical protein M430DRAFT_57587 [Amorphotheca resinae ATCC 22711]